MNSRVETIDIMQPKRRKHSYTQSIRGTPDEVFPLLCPVREADWIPDWRPDFVISRSGVAEQDCIFQTPGETAPSVWLINRHDPLRHRVEMYKVTPGVTVGKLEIGLSGAAGGGTAAKISYEYTSLGPPGDAFIEAFTEEAYEQIMRRWERQMNHYLARGSLLDD